MTINTPDGDTYRFPYCTPDSVNEIFSNNCQPYISFNWEASNEERVLERKYIMILDTLGDVGGIFEIMIFIGGIMYFFYKERAYHNFMKKELLKESGDHYKAYFKDIERKELLDSMNNLLRIQKDANRVLK